MTTETYQQGVQKLAMDPDSGRVTPIAAARLVNGRARISAGPFNWDADLPPVVGGANQAPSPTAYLLGALASCAVAFIHDMLALEFGVVIDDLSAEARCATDLAGLVGLDGADPRLRGLSLDISVQSSSSDDSVAAMRQAWLDRCPVYLALLEPNAVSVTFSRATA
jgi:uncharacterized OsmC-like protein